MTQLPDMLNIPEKLMPMLLEINDYRFFLAEGGRGSGKTHAVARIFLYIASMRKMRIVCGREIQNTIEESVYTVLCDLIRQHDLNFTIYKNKIVHNHSESEIKFKGFREHGSVNIKGVEGADILWIDEAQAITKHTMDILVPTIRKSNSKLFFTMNRFMRDDAVYEFCADRDECLHIHINYFENPFCPLELKVEAETMKNKSLRDYKHIWLGQPLNTADDYLFNYDKLMYSMEVTAFGDLFKPQRVIGIDFAAQGNDQCVLTVLDRLSPEHWELVEQKAWDESDTMISVGKIVSLLGEYHPDEAILDVGGMGHVVYDRLVEVGVKINRFDGASVDGVDKQHYVNARAEGYYTLKDWFDRGCLQVHEKDKDVLTECSKIKMKYRSDGRRILQQKTDMKKEMGHSPDRADSLMMAVWCAVKILGQHSSVSDGDIHVKRVSNNSRRKR